TDDPRTHFQRADRRRILFAPARRDEDGVSWRRCSRGDRDRGGRFDLDCGDRVFAAYLDCDWNSYGGGDRRVRLADVLPDYGGSARAGKSGRVRRVFWPRGGGTER